MSKKLSSVDQIKKLLIERRRMLYVLVLSSLVLGFLGSLMVPVRFYSSVSFITEVESEAPDYSNLAQRLGGFAGFGNLSISPTSGITPEMYQEIISDPDFVRAVLSDSIRIKEINRSVNELLIESNRSFGGFVSELIAGVKGKVLGNASHDSLDSVAFDSSETYLTTDQWRGYSAFSKLVSVDFGTDNGLVKISCRTKYKQASTRLCNKILEHLSKKILVFKTKKELTRFSFIEEQYLESKNLYGEKQYDLAKFLEENRNVTSSLFEIEKQNLSNDLNFNQELYFSFSQKYAEAKISLQEKMPVVHVIEKPVIAKEPEGPGKMKLMLLALIIGFVIYFIIIVYPFI